jgi:two-component system LytT family response regulator
MRIRTLIADDEPLALDRLRSQLGEIDEVDLVSAVGSGAEAIAQTEALKPDLILLDVEMPKLDGFDVVEALQDAPAAQPPPLVCFVTAYPQFALEAYESGPIDFLCKPVRIARLRKMIGRAARALEQRDASQRLRELAGQLQSLRQSRGPAVEELSVWIHHRGKMFKIVAASIDWIKAEGEYVRIHVGATTYLHRSPISKMADELREAGFVRVHRSAVINRARVVAIRSSRGGTKIELASEVHVPVGRRYSSSVREIAGSP